MKRSHIKIYLKNNHLINLKVYNLTIEKVAQATANMCKMEHPGTVGYGENLWANSWAMDNLSKL